MTNSTTGADRTPLVIRSPEEAIAAVPYLLGFHPQDSLVAIGTGGPHRTCTLRLDLPHPSRAWVLGEQVALLLARNEFAGAVLIAYGPAGSADPVVEAALAAFGRYGVAVIEAARVAGGRWWSYTCDDPRCCPPEGSPYDIAGSVVAAEATLAGHVAYRDRAELARTVAPIEDGPARRAMRRATNRAEERLFGWAAAGLDPAAVRDRTVEAGMSLVKELADRVAAGAGPPDDDEIAWLGVVLGNLRVRDEAWVRIDVDGLDPHIAFWRDVLRRIEEPYAAAPGCLLAYAAFAAGDGGLANVALDRALGADPGYSMAALLRDLLLAGVPPSVARLRMTPGELAAAYAARPAAYSDGETGAAAGKEETDLGAEPGLETEPGRPGHEAGPGG